MRQVQPVGEVLGRLVWGHAVEGHHRGGNPRLADKLRTPAITDRHDLDGVRAAADGFFESMNDHGVMVSTEARLILRRGRGGSSEAPRER